MGPQNEEKNERGGGAGGTAARKARHKNSGTSDKGKAGVARGGGLPERLGRGQGWGGESRGIKSGEDSYGKFGSG